MSLFRTMQYLVINQVRNFRQSIFGIIFGTFYPWQQVFPRWWIQFIQQLGHLLQGNLESNMVDILKNIKLSYLKELIICYC